MVLMQRYLTCPDDPDSEADIAMQIMISQAAVDSKGFEVIAPQAVASIKRHHATLSSRIAALSARLSLESKIREAAQSLLKLHADNKKLARQARDHLEAANRKVDQVATELWKLTQLAADLQRTLLQHTSGVLALGVVRLEDQGRRERELHAVQIQEARIGQDVKEQFESMAKVIMNLESDTLEAQSLLEDKDRAIERLMKQLEHQRNLFIRLDDQQQKTMALSRSQQKNMDAIENDSNDSKPMAEMTQFLHQVQEQLQRILQQQQQQRVHHTKQPSKELVSKSSVQSESQDPSLPPLREDSTSSAPSDGNTTTGTSTASETVVGSKSSTLSGGSSHFSMDGIRSTLDALENHMTESQQKMNVLEGELGLLRRQSVVLSASRNNSIKIKNFSAPRPGMLAEETIRSALEKSLKDALLAKEVAQQELENERQRWQEDQDHRISALEESIVAVEEQDKTAQAGKAIEGNTALSKDEAVQELRRQLQEAIDEIDILNHQQQANLKSLRQLFDLIPDTRRKSHMQLYSSHQQLQQQIVSSPDRNVGSVYGNGVSPAGSTTSLLSVGAIGFSMEALIVRIKELVTRSQQVEQDNADLRQQIGKPAIKSRAETPEEPQQYQQQQQQQQQQDDLSTWILKTDLERLQANAEMAQLLETELDMLKQHTDVLLDENARLADLAAASATGSPAPIRLTGFGVALQKPVQDDTFDELQEIIRIKDRLLLERDRLVQEQEEALRQAQVEIEKVKSTNADGMDGAVSAAEAVVEVSEFDVATMDILRLKCSKLEDETSEMRMIITALESVKAGSGTGSQILRNLSISSNALSPETSSRSGSPVAPATELYTGGLESGGIGPGSNAAVTIATAALRREFRRAMSELREEKEKAVRKEVEERRRLEKELRHMRRQLHTIHMNAHA
ncbi:hypothetical protein BGZ99_007146 [Dissophora globulifera]|uniref:Up-regulated during septation protein 1 domain-containing protein n=1 Tax=Dissophora globulifera TaxID=979702 RepID=A0A9P6URC7_9FUNG|nr:hypothetical protein BGZ99_007146 [Dissophora globulifera]